MDGNVRIIGDFRKYIEQESKGAPILCLKHPSRNSVYEEAEELRQNTPKIKMKLARASYLISRRLNKDGSKSKSKSKI